MPVSIGSNVEAIRAERQLDLTSSKESQIFERLSSGSRINHASDDAAGLAIASSLNLDTRVFAQALRNVNDATSLLNIADGALEQLSTIVVRQRELATQASNGSYSFTQRVALDNEANALVSEYNRIISATKFNGTSLLDGSMQQTRIQAGYGSTGSLLLSLGNQLAAPTGTFAAALTTNGYGTIFGYTSADIGGDGIPDIIDDSGSFIAVYQGNGNGTFKGENPGLTTTLPTIAVTTGLLNNDLRADIVAVDRTHNNINVFLNLGNSTYAGRVTYSMGTSPNDLIVADFNGDSITDVVTVSSSSATIRLGNGNGTFKVSTSYALGGDYVISGDLNGDGNLDLIAADYTAGTVKVALGNGNGSFTSVLTTLTALNQRGASVSDLDSDGILDLVTVNSAALNVFRGKGDGTFSLAGTYASMSEAANLALDDFNGDSITDAAFSSYDTESIAILYGNSDGSFSAPLSLAATEATIGLLDDDFNHDGKPDLVALGLASVAGSHQTYLGISYYSTFEARLNLRTISSAHLAMDYLDGTLTRIANERGAIGSLQTRLGVAASNLSSSTANLTASRSRIVDADIAEDAAELVKIGILKKVSAQVIANASLLPKIALNLLAG